MQGCFSKPTKFFCHHELCLLWSFRHFGVAELSSLLFHIYGSIVSQCLTDLHKIRGTDLKIYGFSGMSNNGLITEKWCWMSKERKHKQCNHLQMQIYLEWKNSLHTSLQILQSCCRELVWYMREKLTLPSGDQVSFSQQSHQWKEQQNACNANIKYIHSH